MLLNNIGVMATMEPTEGNPLGLIEDASLLVGGDEIVWHGQKGAIPESEIEHEIDCQRCLVIPGLIDCHSHLIFSGSRSHEFAERMQGKSYQAIMKGGGGIMSTVNATRNSSDEELLALALTRARSIQRGGVTTIEAKSGYGLDHENELRILRLLKRLEHEVELTVHPTFLGAHVVPPEFKTKREEYISMLIDELLVQVAEENLAIDCDVFCEQGAFGVDESIRILSRAEELGMGLRAHVQQLSHSHGISLLKDLPLKSISHADYLSEADLAILEGSEAVVEILPIAGLFLRSPQKPPIKLLIDRGVTLAIATDFNPGSAMCHDLVLAARLGVTQYYFDIANALWAITRNAAKSLGRSDIGVIRDGAQADLLITNCHCVEEFFYDWTKHPVEMVIKKGRRVV